MSIEVAAIHSLLLLFFLMNFFFSQGKIKKTTVICIFSYAKIGYLISLTVYEE